LSELDLPATTLAALGTAGYETFLQIIDLERRDFLGIEGIGEEEADRLLQLIDELTVVEGEPAASEDEEAEDEAAAGGDEADAVVAATSEEEDREPSE
jgi:hypothetical protein